MNNEKTPNKPKQIILTKMRFQKILLSTPNGLQYSANKNTIAATEMIILIRLACFSVNLFCRLRSAVIPKAIKINPNQ